MKSKKQREYRKRLIKIELIFLVITILFSLFGFILVSYDGEVGNMITGFSTFSIYPIEEPPLGETINETYSIPPEEKTNGTVAFMPQFDFGIMAAPVIGSVILNTTNPASNDTNQNLTCYNYSVSDDDGDDVKTIFNWWYNTTSRGELEPMMKLYMPFENHTSNASKYALDYSGNKNNGTVQGATWSATGGYDGFGAYSFVTNDYINAGGATTLDILGPLTIATWINTNDATAYQEFICKGDLADGGTFSNYCMLIMNTGVIRFGIRDVGVGNLLDTQTSLTNNKWYHFAVTFDPSTNAVALYLNGSLDKSGTITNDPVAQTDDPLYIGALQNGAGTANQVNGEMDEIRIYNYTLSANQIKLLYENKSWMITSEETSTGDFWKCEVIPNDGTTDGTAVNSSELEILSGNTAPVSGSVTIYPSTAYTDSILSGNITITDVDGGAIITNATWYNGTIAYISLNITSTAGDEINYSLTEGIQHKAETWNISFVSCDSSGACDEASATKTIGNTAPTTPTIGDPANESRQTGNSVTLNCDSSTDADGDTIQYVFYGDTSNPPTTVLQNLTTTSYALSTTDGFTYWWYCKAHDNESTSSATTIKQFVENNQSLLTNIYIRPTTAYTDSILSGNITVYDSEDSMTVYMNWTNGTTHYSSISQNSISSGSEINYSLAEGIQHKGETWNFSVQVWDGYELSEMNSTTITITNTIPTVPTIGNPVNESRQTGNSVTLNCGSSTDPDEADTIYYEFYGDVDTNPPTSLLQNATGTTYAWGTTDGRTYWWRCRANDAEDATSYTTTKQFIENNLSIVTNVTLDPTVAYTNSTINGSVIVYDSEDSMTVYMNWTNGTTHYSEYSKASVSSGSKINFTLTPEIQHRGETWNFTARIWDGYELSDINSTFINISDYRPEPTLVDPSNNSDSTTHYTNFTYNVSDIDEVVDNCSLWLEQVNDSTGLIVNATDTSITLDVNQSFEVNLSHGYHNWLIECTDDENNKTNSSQWTYHILNDYPLITQIKPLNNTYITNGSIDFEFNITDQDYIVNCSLTLDNTRYRHVIDNTTYGYTGLPRAPTSNTLQWGLQSGTHNYSITCCDMYNKCNLTANYTFSISLPYYPSPSQGSLGSSGGGPSGSREDQTVTVEGANIILSYMAPAPLKIIPNDPTLAVYEIIIEIAKEVENIKVNVNEPTTIPIEKPGLEVFKYLQIETENLPNSFVSGVYIKFKVPKSIIKNKEVALYHYTDTWNKLQTKLIESDELFNSYEAISPGLSYFAIILREPTTLEKLPTILKFKPKVIIERLQFIKQQIKTNYILITIISVLVLFIVLLRIRKRKR